MTDRNAVAGATWYEFRVWGRHSKACHRLESLASQVVEEEVDDWYLLSGDRDVNAKVRDGSLKLKRYVGERKGFERWTSDRFGDADAAPEPFDDVIEEIPLDGRSATRRKLRKALRRLDPDLGLRPVPVHKRRRRYRVGSSHAEVTTIELVDVGTRLHSLVIEGPDLDELVVLRDRLGLRGEPNVAVHRAIDELL